MAETKYENRILQEAIDLLVVVTKRAMVGEDKRWVRGMTKHCVRMICDRVKSYDDMMLVVNSLPEETDKVIEDFCRFIAESSLSKVFTAQALIDAGLIHGDWTVSNWE